MMICAGDGGTFKICTGCGEAKPLTCFRPHNGCVAGLDSRCRRCMNKMSEVWRSKNPKPSAATMTFICAECGNVGAKRNKGGQKYCEECAANVRRARDRKRRPRTVIGMPHVCEDCGCDFIRKAATQVVCQECIGRRNSENGKKWIEQNPDARRAAAKRYNDRRRSTPQGHLEWTMRAAVKRGLFKDTKAGRRTFDLLGYTADELRVWLERLFLPGMSWDNYGEWHIDHRIPLAEFEYQTPDCPDFKRAWALTNLQPLWKLDNLKKGAKRLYLI